LAFDDVMLEPGTYRVSVGNRGSEPATIELRLDDPLQGELLSTVRIPPTDQLIPVTGELAPAIGVHTLYVVFSAASVVVESLTV
jgi:beta-glucosidase